MVNGKWIIEEVVGSRIVDFGSWIADFGLSEM
jgi:hypothetical protein